MKFKNGFWFLVSRFQVGFGALVLLLALAISFGACFEPREGCLDIAAINFNAAADRDCCCHYPDLILTTDQVYDTLFFRRDSLYVGTGGHLFRIKSIVFYLSEFEVFKASELFKIGDEVDLKVYDAANNDTITNTFVDDFTLLRRAPLENFVGSFREDGYFDKIRFRLGLSVDAENVIPALAPSDHPLSPQNENLYQNGYSYLQAIVVRDSMSTTAPDTIRIGRAELGDFFIEGTGNFQHQIGYNFPLTLRADWARLFEGINWTTHDIPAWKSQIVVNLPSVFSVSQ
jgi:hypothetical protein